MTELIFVLDESGAKNYSDKEETYPGELGVACGFAFFKYMINDIREDLSAIRNQYLENMKLHITDLSEDKQEQLRKDLFAWFRARSVFWTYTAIYAQGFYEHFNFKIDPSELKINRNPNIKFSNHKKVESLHAWLLAGTITKLIAFCMDRGCVKPYSIEIISDNINAKTLNDIRFIMKDFLAFGEANIRIHKAYNIETKEVLITTSKFEIHEGKEQFNIFNEIEYKIHTEDSELTLAADVLANSVNYYLKKYQEIELGAKLHHMKTINKHPLAPLVYGIYTDEENMYCFEDLIYRHPKNV